MWPEIVDKVVVVVVELINYYFLFVCLLVYDGFTVVAVVVVVVVIEHKLTNEIFKHFSVQYPQMHCRKQHCTTTYWRTNFAPVALVVVVLLPLLRGVVCLLSAVAYVAALSSWI